MFTVKQVRDNFQVIHRNTNYQQWISQTVINGYTLSVIAGDAYYSTPRKNLKNWENYSHFEIALMNDKGDFINLGEGVVTPYVTIQEAVDLANEKANPDPRQNENISTEQVIELSCDLANEMLENFHKKTNKKFPLYDDYEEGTYSDEAQDIFNEYYDQIEKSICDLMVEYPKFNIADIHNMLCIVLKLEG